MDGVKRKARFAGLLLIGGMIAGILSVAPAVDSAEYLTEAAAHSHQVILAALAQFMMALAYIGIAILLYPIVKRYGKSLALGFLSLRIIATTLVVVGTVVLLSLLSLSQEFVHHLPQHPVELEAVGNMLKVTRDYINHVFMVLVLCAGNGMLYALFLQSRLVPQWISVWGLVGTALSALASVLILFQVVDIITPEYLILNVPTALLELVLGIWLLIKGFDNRTTMASE